MIGFNDGSQIEVGRYRTNEEYIVPGMFGCEKDTAIQDIQDLVDNDILREDIPGAKRPSYSIINNPEDITVFFF